jgi:DNA-binding NtrC family response regulator
VGEGPAELDTTRSYWPPAEANAAEAPSLIVIEGERSSRVALPRNGRVTIGRDADADLHLGDELASRKHARLTIVDGQLRLADLDSHNGTLVNGERIAGTVVLGSGDVFTIGETTLVVRGTTQKRPGKSVLDGPQLRQRLDEEMTRAGGYHRPLALAIVALGDDAPAHDVAAEALLGALRGLDQVASVGAAQLAVLLPELDENEAAEATTRALAKLRTVAPAARAGVAAFPDDGCEGDALLASARAALAGAAAGEVKRAREAVTTITLGDRQLVVADAAVSRLYALIKRLARTELPVLILGESGAGKENAAFAVHHWSPRAGKPFVPLNCAALQETLVESELFGYEKGAFSGAVASKPGLLERADGGTVFLDEVGELSAAAQAKLLRVVEHKRLTRIGDVRERDVDIRIVAATNRQLEREVQAGRFREDLFFRLCGATVVLPPLRERPREVPILARRFLASLAPDGKAIEIAPSAMQRLAAYQWPGNVRELRHVIAYSAALVDGDTLEAWHLPDKLLGTSADALADEPEAPGARQAKDPAAATGAFRPLAEELRELERRRMLEALRAAGGVQRRAAELIGMPLRTFAVKHKQYQLRDGS